MSEAIFECPAYKVYPAPRFMMDHDIIALCAGDELACKDFRYNGYKLFTCGSVAHGAVKRAGLLPGQSIHDREEDNRTRCHGERHFIFGNGVCISDVKSPQEKYFEISFGDLVLFEGVIYTIESASNDNLRFVEVKDYEWIHPRDRVSS